MKGAGEPAVVRRFPEKPASRIDTMTNKPVLNPEVLRAVPLFSLFDHAQLEMLVPFLQIRSYSRNTPVLRAGEETDALYVILSGRVKVLIPDKHGREVILAVMGPNEFFGEMGLLDQQARSASVETLETSKMVRLSKAGFFGCLENNFGLAMLIIRNLVKRLRDADRQIESLALVDVYGRVARLLLDMAQNDDGQLKIATAPPKQEIARMIGASREMVSRVVKDLQDRGLIRAEGREIFVLDALSLEKRTV
jgi:CRP/FNR family cyclic AMP-dependent transcriptional regulator